jgi:hypothetical protein
MDAIKQQMKKAVRTGDLPRLKSLVASFPDSFETFRYGNTSDDNLVDIAWKMRHDAVAIYLIVAHEFEVSPSFEKAAKRYGGEAFAQGANEYHQTMEVLANAIVGSPSDSQRNLACYAIKHWALGQKTLQDGTETPINPELMEHIRSGKLREFCAHKSTSDSTEMIPTAHSVRMVQTLHEHIQTIEEQCRADSAKNMATAVAPTPLHTRRR